MIINNIKSFLKSNKYYWNYKRRKYFSYLEKQNGNNNVESLNNDKKVFFFLAADYGNLGDYAITLAQKYFLQNIFPKHNIIVVNLNETYKAYSYSLNPSVKDDDIVTIVGGGNMGSLYYSIELSRQFVISRFKNQNIICFPQSLYYLNDEKGKSFVETATKFYNKNCKRLTLLFREKLSYEKACDMFPQNKVRLVPDIVFTLDKVVPCPRNNEVLFCIRDDKESYIGKNLVNDIKSYISSIGNECIDCDTFIGEGIFGNDVLNESFERLLNKYRHSKLVVTDRLHGMIFSYITGTPAIVLPNNNGKIEYSYQWIKDCEYIYYCTKPTISIFKDYFGKLESVGFDYERFLERRQVFINLITKAIKE